jgi:hypothetical protein
MVNNRSNNPGDYMSNNMSSPSRFQHELLLDNIEDDEGEHTRLRNPGGTNILSPTAALVLQGTAAPGAPPSHEVCVIEALQQSASDLGGVGCYDLRLIEAERLFNEQNYARAYEVIKAVVEAD